MKFRWQKRSNPIVTLDEMLSMFSFGGLGYQLSGMQTMVGQKEEDIVESFVGYVQGAYKSNGPIFACMLVRQLLFSEARFQFRQMKNGRPGDLFGTSALAPLENPWPGATTGDLLTRMEQDSSLAGNAYVARRAQNRLRRLRPDWVTIIAGSNDPSRPNMDLGDIDAEVIGYLYHPGGRTAGKTPEVLFPESVAHYAPIPDPVAAFRGMSWLTPIVREIMADQSTTSHKLQFFENGATPNMVVTLNENLEPEAFERWVELFEASQEGVLNAYKTLIIGGGADVEVVGKDLKELDFKATQGAGETRIAAAAGVPPVIVGLSEGLQAATYSNYSQARRRLADGTMRPLWRNAAGSLARLVNVPNNADLWYDDRDIPFLQEDQKDLADIHKVHAESIKALTEAGYEPDSVVEAIVSGDFKRLKHSGAFSVQLQKPGDGAPAGNGNGNGNGQASAPEILAGLRTLIER